MFYLKRIADCNQVMETWFNLNIVIWTTIVIFYFSTVTCRIPDEPPIPPMPTIASVFTTPPSVDIPENTCFYADSSVCDLPRNNTGCKECIPHPTVPNSLVCCNVTDIEKSISCVPNPSGDNSSYWINLHIINATFDELDIPHKYWKRLDSLVVTDGRVNKITKEFTKFASPQCINISNNNLIVIHPRAFKDLVRLKVLDISYNNLSTIPNLNSIPKNLSLDIRGNKPMLCQSLLEFIERSGVHFVEPDDTYCLTNQTFNWFNSTDDISIRNLERIIQLKSECPYIPGYGNCTCTPGPMTYEFQQHPHLSFVAQVDCSSLGLIKLPEKLPLDTISLNVSNNSITSLSALNDDLTYKNLKTFDADDNQISSILDLEGTAFLNNFNALRLRRNKLKSIPIYILSNALDKNQKGRIVYLEGNQLHCDCNSAKVLKLWLLAKKSHIIDYDQILCENINQKVLDLSEKKLCKSHHDWTYYIYYLITAEIILLLAIIMKVLYDYWIFKTAGYLPWPASKMPKLPCDWLCES